MISKKYFSKNNSNLLTKINKQMSKLYLYVCKKKLTLLLHVRLKLFFLKKEKIDFPLFKNPEVSVIIVLFNQAQFTLECLKLIQKQLDVAYEIIIVDNASTDATHSLLEACSNIEIIKNGKNIGFLHAANQGAQSAKSKNILFLNNDIWQLNDRAFSIALQTLNSDINYGVVGGKVILPDGRLQEAGVILHQKGIYQYGRGKNPNWFEFNFQRHVDYCSGLFLLTRKDLFFKLGGFDIIYAPAYWEDSDYCLRVNHLGYKVIYDPQIIVGHIENGSVIKKYITKTLWAEKNSALFFKKHSGWLSSRQAIEKNTPLNKLNILIYRSHHHAAFRILFIGKDVPTARLLSRMKRACDKGQVVSYYSLSKFCLSYYQIYSLFDNRVEVCDEHQISWDDFIFSRKNYYHKIEYEIEKN